MHGQVDARALQLAFVQEAHPRQAQGQQRGDAVLLQSEAGGGALLVVVFEEVDAAAQEVRRHVEEVVLRLGVVVVGEVVVEPLVVGVVEAELLEVPFLIPVNLGHEQEAGERAFH